MWRSLVCFAGCAVWCLLSCGPVFADSVAKPETKAADGVDAVGAPKKPEGLQDELIVTRHQAKIGGQEIAYTATAGTLVVRRDSADAKPRASIFFVAYTRYVDDLLGADRCRLRRR